MSKVNINDISPDEFTIKTDEYRKEHNLDELTSEQLLEKDLNDDLLINGIKRHFNELINDFFQNDEQSESIRDKVLVSISKLMVIIDFFRKPECKVKGTDFITSCFFNDIRDFYVADILLVKNKNQKE